MLRMTILVTAVALSALTPSSHARARYSAARVVLEWNQLLDETLPAPGNPLTPRFYSMAHIAMFDAINAIERQYEPYRVGMRHANGSPDAAAARAAHDVLVAINPGAAARYDAALAEEIGNRPSGFVRNGAEVGARVAREILTWRQNDGWVVSPFPAYSEPLLAGRWRPTPPASATFTHLQKALPMALLSSTQYLPLPPPVLTSERYAADLNEVQRLGGAVDSERIEDQTALARLWSGLGTTTGFFAVWNSVARDVVQASSLSLVEAARVFVLLNVSIHDALQTTQASKFVYGMWRPDTAIREAGSDLNPATSPDPRWTPLLTTPPYPSYAGNLATIGASAARTLELAFETDNTPVDVTWRQQGGPDVTRHYASFRQAADEEAMARIYGGIHFRFDQEAGQSAGTKVAEYVFANFMRPRRR
jgi:hypothetical protein